MLAKFARRSNAWLLRAHGGNIMKSKITIAGALPRAALITLAVFVPAMALFSRPSPIPKAAPRSSVNEGHCVPIGGMLMTNFGGFGPNTTLGTATGDLRGAVGVNILSVSQGSGNTTLFAVQHHWVTESGDTLSLDQATATSTQVAPGLFAIVNYSAHLSGGTGRFAGATGDLTNIGEADLSTGQLVLRYRGQVCFAEQD